MLTSSSVNVTAVSGGIPCHADGETVCEQGSSIAIELLPGVLSLIA